MTIQIMGVSYGNFMQAVVLFVNDTICLKPIK